MVFHKPCEDLICQFFIETAHIRTEKAVKSIHLLGFLSHFAKFSDSFLFITLEKLCHIRDFLHGQTVLEFIFVSHHHILLITVLLAHLVRHHEIFKVLKAD